MNVREVRTAARIVGRRTTLRYLLIGLGASVVSACGGDAGSTAQGATGTGDGTPDPATGGAGPTAKAFAAFARGRWSVRTTMPDGQTVHGTAEIKDGTWRIRWEAHGTWSGTWALQGGRLALTFAESVQDVVGSARIAVPGIPSTVGDKASLVLPWQLPGTSGQNLRVGYNGGTLRIEHVERSGTTVHVCTRA